MNQQTAAEFAAAAALRAQALADRPGVVLSFGDAVALANMWTNVASQLMYETEPKLLGDAPILDDNQAERIRAAWQKDFVTERAQDWIVDPPSVRATRDTQIAMPLERERVAQAFAPTVDQMAEAATRVLPAPMMCLCDRKAFEHPWSVSAGCPR